MNTSNWSTEQMYTLLSESIRSGITELILLEILTEGDAYGYEVYKKLVERTDGVFHFFHTAIYTFLRRMKEKGLIDVSDKEFQRPTARHMVYYTITSEGKAYLEYGKRQFNLIWGTAARLLNDSQS